MIIILPFIALGLIAGWIGRGTLRNFEHVKIRWWGLALVGLLLTTVPLPDTWIARAGLPILLGSYVVLLVLVLVNRHVPAAWIMVIGLLMNLAVVGLNQGMPVSSKAVEISDGGPPLTGREFDDDPQRHMMTDDDILRPLGDVIPVPWPIRVVMSPGDVVLYAGVGISIAMVMMGRFDREKAAAGGKYRGKHAIATPR